MLQNFARFSIPMKAVQTCKGFFIDSLPLLRKQLLSSGERLAILRMDGDMYDSTADILYDAAPVSNTLSLPRYVLC